MKKSDHLHKYRRMKFGKGTIYRCMVPGCSHYISSKLILNRLCECWRCGSAMVIDYYAASLAKPHCQECTRSKKQDQVNKLAELFQ